MYKTIQVILAGIAAVLGAVLFVVFVLGIPGCIADDENPDPDGGTDADTDIDADSDVDGDSDSDPINYDEVEVCAVAIQFAYYSNGDVFEVTLTNYNAVTAMVLIKNTDTQGVVVKSCLWPSGSIGTGEGGDEDVVETSYDISDPLSIDVRQLSGMGYEATCDVMFDTYFEGEATACAITEYP
ncbi:MAG: hypothetical protein M0Q92_14315 [Methanoregula sp.]|jgi:hypothetical protein|nr:hypothetical protein [Methanoregula sp.]